MPPTVVYPYSLHALIGGQSTGSCSIISTTRIICTLPYISNINAWLSIQVFAGSLLSSNNAYLVRYDTASSPPTSIISRIEGCPVQSGSATSGCSWNNSVILFGSNLPTGSVTLSFYNSNYYDYYAAIVVTSYSSSMLIARLPYIPISMFAVSTLLYSVQAFNSSVITNSVPYLSFSAQSPYVYRVTGCAYDNAVTNTTTGCTPGTSVRVFGNHFVPTTVVSTLFGFIGGYATSNCSFVSTTQLTCVLPAVSTFNVYTSIQVYNGGQASNNPYLLLFAPPAGYSSSSSSSSTGRFITTTPTSSPRVVPPTPIITSIRGCAVTVGNGTSGCNYNDTAYIYGSNLPTGPYLQVQLLAQFGGYYATNAVSYNSTVLSARLPYIAVSTITSYGVQVTNNTVTTSAVNSLSYGSQSPWIYRISGCPVNNYPVNNGTSDCRAGVVVTIEGHHRTTQHNL